MRKKLLSLMPEFQEIQNKELQEKTIQVWIEAMQVQEDAHPLGVGHRATHAPAVHDRSAALDALGPREARLRQLVELARHQAANDQQHSGSAELRREADLCRVDEEVLHQ